MESLLVKNVLTGASGECAEASPGMPRLAKPRSSAVRGSKSSSLFTNKSLSTLRKLLGQQPEVDRVVSRRVRSQSADVSDAKAQTRESQKQQGVVVRHGVRLRLQPNNKHSPLLRSPLIGKILESVSDAYEERCGRGSGVLSRSAR